MKQCAAIEEETVKTKEAHMDLDAADRNIFPGTSAQYLKVKSLQFVTVPKAMFSMGRERERERYDSAGATREDNL